MANDPLLDDVRLVLTMDRSGDAVSRLDHRTWTERLPDAKSPGGSKGSLRQFRAAGRFTAWRRVPRHAGWTTDMARNQTYPPAIANKSHAPLATTPLARQWFPGAPLSSLESWKRKSDSDPMIATM
jgi:hypothetical protein